MQCTFYESSNSCLTKFHQLLFFFYSSNLWSFRWSGPPVFLPTHPLRARSFSHRHWPTFLNKAQAHNSPQFFSLFMVLDRSRLIEPWIIARGSSDAEGLHPWQCNVQSLFTFSKQLYHTPKDWYIFFFQYSYLFLQCFYLPFF